MAEEIITIFKADLSDLEAKVATGEKLIEGYMDTAEGAAAASDTLGKATGNAAAKIAMLGAASQKAVEGQKALAKESATTTAALTKEQEALDKARGNFTRLVSELRKTSDARKALNAEIQANQAEYEALNKTITQSGVKSDALTKAVEENRAASARLSTELSDLIATEVLLNKEVNDAGRALLQANAAAERSVKGMTDLEKAAARAAAGESKFNEESRETIGILQQLKARIDLLNQKKLSLTDPKQIAATNVELRKVTAEYNKLNAAQPAQGGIRGLFKQLGGQGSGLIGNSLQGLTSAVGGTGALGGAFSALTGPIGLAAAAVVGFFANFTKLDSVKVGLDALKRSFDLSLNRLANLDFKGLIDPRIRAQDVASAAAIANALDEVEDKQLDVNKANREAEVQLAQRNQKLRDATLSEEERLKIADEITAIEVDRSNRELAFIDERIKAQALINAAELNSLGEINDANKLALSELNNERASAEARSIQLTETVERRRNAIVEQGINERSAAEQRGIAARDKAQREAAEEEAKRIKKQQDIAQVEGQILTITAELDEADLKSGLNELDTKLLDTEKKFVQIAANIKRAFAGLRTLQGLTGPDGQPTDFAATPEGQAQGAELATRETTALQSVNEASFAAANELRAIEAARQLSLQQETEDKLAQLRLTKDEAELQAIRDKFSAIRDEIEERYSSEEERQRLNTEVTLLEDQELFDAMQEQKAEQDELEAERLQKTIDIATETSAQMASLIERAVEDGKVSAEEFGKTLVLILLDTLEKILLIKALEITAFLIEKGAEQAGLPGAILGAVAGAVIVGLLQGAFAAVKSAVAGNFEGDPYVEGKPTWSGRDGYLRRLDKGERVVKAKDNQKYWEPLEAMRKGKFDRWVQENAVDADFHIEPFTLTADMDMMHRVNRYMDGDQGQRIAQSIMFPKYFDRNLVKSQERTNEELHENNALLGVLIDQGKRRQRHARSW